MTRLVILASALTLLLAGPATASHVGCGDTIIQDTTLDSDLVCAGDGVTVGATGVTLDLGGHVLQGSGTGAGVSVPWNQAASTQIEGGTIRGFADGIHVDESLDAVVRDAVLEGNQTGLDCFMAAGCSIVDSVVRHNLGRGVSMHAIDVGTGRPSFIQGNFVHDNEVGLDLIDYRTIVSGNRIENNRLQGIDVGLADLVEILRNRIGDNGAEGILISADGTTNVTLVGNRVFRNAGDGVFAGGGGEFGDTHVTVRDNKADRNGEDGIDVDTAEFSFVAANKAFFNADLGIEAAPGTTDGGGNKAKHNGNPAQCVGVSCK